MGHQAPPSSVSKRAPASATRRQRLSSWSLLVLPSLLSCTKEPSRPNPGKVFDLEVLSTEKCSLPAPLGAPERSALGVKVKLTAHVPEGVAANYFYASVLAADGSRYLAELPGCSPVLSGAPLYAGQTQIGYLNIPIPAHKQPRTLVYAPPLAAYPVARRVREIELVRKEDVDHE